mgnify:FL=1
MITIEPCPRFAQKLNADPESLSVYNCKHSLLWASKLHKEKNEEGNDNKHE